MAVAKKKNSIGEELVNEIQETKDEKNRKIMKEHLSWCILRVEELNEEKAKLEKALKKGEDHLKRIKGMSLNEFGDYAKEENMAFDGSTVNEMKTVLSKRLSVRFNKRY